MAARPSDPRGRRLRRLSRLGHPRCRPLPRLLGLGRLHVDRDSASGVLSWAILPRSIEVLFIVSGFVVYLPTVARDGDFGKVGCLAIRRAARLIPAYYVGAAARDGAARDRPDSPRCPAPARSPRTSRSSRPLRSWSPTLQARFRRGAAGLDPLGGGRLLRRAALRRRPCTSAIRWWAADGGRGPGAWRVLADHSYGVAHLFGTDLSSDATNASPGSTRASSRAGSSRSRSACRGLGVRPAPRPGRSGPVGADRPAEWPP